MSDPLYRRVIVKLSGEALSGNNGFGLDQTTVERIAADLVAAAKFGVELGVVVGGGNIFRGVQVSARGVPRPVGDTMGMLATVMNCLVLEAAIGLWGFVLHASMNLRGPSIHGFNNFIYGAPPMAPLLFPNLMVLGAIALWQLRVSQEIP